MDHISQKYVLQGGKHARLGPVLMLVSPCQGNSHAVACLHAYRQLVMQKTGSELDVNHKSYHIANKSPRAAYVTPCWTCPAAFVAFTAAQ